MFRCCRISSNKHLIIFRHKRQINATSTWLIPSFSNDYKAQRIGLGRFSIVEEYYCYYHDVSDTALRSDWNQHVCNNVLRPSRHCCSFWSMYVNLPTIKAIMLEAYTRLLQVKYVSFDLTLYSTPLTDLAQQYPTKWYWRLAQWNLRLTDFRAAQDLPWLL